MGVAQWSDLSIFNRAAEAINATQRAASDFATRLPQIGQKPVETQPAAPIPYDFQLTGAMTDLLVKPLSLAGFQVEPKPRRFLKSTIVHTLAKNGVEVSILALPTDMARNPADATQLAFSALEHFFDNGSRLCLLAETIDLPHKSLRDIIEKIWARELRVKWLPWQDITALQNAGADTVSDLKDLLGITGGPVPQVAQKKELVPQDKIALIGVLTAFDEFGTTDRRQTMLGVAGLGEFADLPEGNARTAAGALLLRMEAKGGDPHPIRLLIDYVLGSKPSSDDTKTLNQLIQRYDFLHE